MRTTPTRMFQPDRIHPKAEAHLLMLANVARAEENAALTR